MNNLLEKIYENVVRFEKEAINMEQRVSEKVIQLSKPYEENLTLEELEELQDLMFEACLFAEHEGFKVGIMCLAKIFTECISETDGNFTE